MTELIETSGAMKEPKVEGEKGGGNSGTVGEAG